MRLYAGPSKQFITQATQDGIASRLKDAFFQYYRYDPSPNEVNAWAIHLGRAPRRYRRHSARILGVIVVMDNDILNYVAAKGIEC